MHAWILREFTNTLSVNFKTVWITYYTFLIPWKWIEENQESQSKQLLWPSGWEMAPLFLAQAGPPSITTISLFQDKQDMKLLLSRLVTKSVVVNSWKQTDLWLWTHLYVRDTCILRQNILTLTRMVVAKRPAFKRNSSHIHSSWVRCSTVFLIGWDLDRESNTAAFALNNICTMSSPAQWLPICIHEDWQHLTYMLTIRIRSYTYNLVHRLTCNSGWWRLPELHPFGWNSPRVSMWSPSNGLQAPFSPCIHWLTLLFSCKWNPAQVIRLVFCVKTAIYICAIKWAFTPSATRNGRPCALTGRPRTTALIFP